MALARLNCGRFNEDGETTTVDHDGAGNQSQVSNATTLKSSVVGTSQARFLGEYNPLVDLPLQRRTMNTDVVLLPELTEALEQLNHSTAMKEHHKKKDSVKAYLDEVAKFSQSTRYRK